MNYLLSPRLTETGAFEVLNIAHRGARAYAPENTLLSFAKAKTFGCQMVELDVRLSKDGVLMVHHDQSLIRCTDAQSKFPRLKSYDLAEFTYAQLSQLDAGSWYIQQLALPRPAREGFMQNLSEEEVLLYISPEDFAQYQTGAVAIPTLEQALTLARDISLSVNIELKDQSTSASFLVNKVVALVQSMAMQKQVLVSAFAWPLLLQVRALDASIATGVLSDRLIAHPQKLLQTLCANAYHPCGRGSGAAAPSAIDFQAFRALRRQGFGINVWTCNRKSEIYRLVKSGVTGIISDFPNRVRDVLLS